jgi:rhodanese-related sulfurtransferase
VQDENQRTSARSLVADARRRIRRVTADELAGELSSGADVVLIDVREEDEIQAHGAIADSVWAPRGMLEFWADPISPDHRDEFDPGRSLILYCANGNRSALAADTLARLGFHDVAQLDGGLKAWKAAGLPVEAP